MKIKSREGESAGKWFGRIGDKGVRKGERMWMRNICFYWITGSVQILKSTAGSCRFTIWIHGNGSRISHILPCIVRNVGGLIESSDHLQG